MKSYLTPSVLSWQVIRGVYRDRFNENNVGCQRNCARTFCGDVPPPSRLPRFDEVISVKDGARSVNSSLAPSIGHDEEKMELGGKGGGSNAGLLQHA